MPDDLVHIDSFGNGLGDVLHPDVNERTESTAINEDNEIDEFRPVYNLTTRTVQEGDTVGAVNNVADCFYSIPFQAANGTQRTYSPISIVRVVFTGGTAGVYPGFAVTVAVLFCFFWWGVRKALRVLFSAFRKGKANV